MVSRGRRAKVCSGHVEPLSAVMRGLDPRIPPRKAWPCPPKRDGRDKPGHDERLFQRFNMTGTCCREPRECRVKRLAVIAFALLAASPGARAQTIQELLKAFTAHWNAPIDPFRIIRNIYYVGTNGLAVYLITSPQGHILIDTALSEATPQIRSSIGELGF